MGQATQTEEPEIGWMNPGGHKVQLEAPAPLKVPAGQALQLSAPGAAKVPAVHRATVGAIVGGSVSAPQTPVPEIQILPERVYRTQFRAVCSVNPIGPLLNFEPIPKYGTLLLDEYAARLPFT